MRRLSLLIRVCMFTALSTFASGKLFAQQAPAASSSDTPELQEIVVTGSMIKRVNAETAEAVTVVKMDTLKDLGVTSVEQALSLITSNNATITTASNVATFNGGASVAALRGMARKQDPGAVGWPAACEQRDDWKRGRSEYDPVCGH